MSKQAAVAKIILPDSDEAAKRVTVTGWVARNGHFWGDDERNARLSGSTHKLCPGDCGNVIERERIQCKACTQRMKNDAWNAAKTEVWNGDDFLYADAIDKYFEDMDHLISYCQGEKVLPSSLRLYICKSNYADKFELDSSFFEDILPEDSEGELPDEIQFLVDAFNAGLRSYTTPLSWEPTDIAAIVNLPEGVVIEAAEDSSNGK